MLLAAGIGSASFFDQRQGSIENGAGEVHALFSQTFEQRPSRVDLPAPLREQDEPQRAAHRDSMGKGTTPTRSVVQDGHGVL
jgi:hypothetical protein